MAGVVHTLLVLLVYSSRTLGSYTYTDNYAEEDYDYSDEEEEEEEEEADFVPLFLSSSTKYSAGEGNSVSLECEVDQLGPLVISWRKVGEGYLATASMVLVRDPRVRVVTSPTSSRLVISSVQTSDQGQYVCELSSRPPVHVTHSLVIQRAPTVEILGKPASGEMSVRAGEELALICKGGGEPTPNIKWMREGQPLADGASWLEADQIIYSRVGRHHAGVYLCQGDNGDGDGGKALDRVNISIIYAPIVTVDQTYVHSPDNTSLELLCTVQANPQAQVKWRRVGAVLGSKARVEFRSPDKHVLVLDSVDQSDMGQYNCSATNSEGYAQTVIDVKNGGPGNATTTGITDNAVHKKKDANHRLFKQILHKMNRMENVNNDIVAAMKEHNRFMFAMMRNQKKILKTLNGTETVY